MVQSFQRYYLFSLWNEHLNNFADLDFLFPMINDQFQRFNHQLGFFCWSWNESKWGQTKFNRIKKHDFKLLLDENKTSSPRCFKFEFFHREKNVIFSIAVFHLSTLAQSVKKEDEEKKLIQIVCKKMLWITLIFAIQLKRDHPVVIFTWLFKCSAQYTYKWSFEPAHRAPCTPIERGKSPAVN